MVSKEVAEEVGGLKTLVPTGTSVLVEGHLEATPEGTKQVGRRHGGGGGRTDAGLELKAVCGLGLGLHGWRCSRFGRVTGHDCNMHVVVRRCKT